MSSQNNNTLLQNGSYSQNPNPKLNENNKFTNRDDEIKYRNGFNNNNYNRHYNNLLFTEGKSEENLKRTKLKYFFIYCLR